MIKSRENLVGAYAFTAGTILAVIVGVITALTSSNVDPIVLIILVILGLIVGYFVSEKDISSFLLASVSVVIASYAGIQGIVTQAAVLSSSINQVMTGILGALLFLFIPATVFVAIKLVFSLAKS